MGVELLNHPGPAWPERIVDVATPTVMKVVQLTPGLPLFDALVEAVKSTGYEYGAADYFGGFLEPLAYCVPGDGNEQQAVTFSEPRLRERVEIVTAASVIGVRHGGPYVHTHASWLTTDGELRAGHLFPESIVGSPAPWAVVSGMPGVHWESDDDPETLMPTFTPSPMHSEVIMQDAILGRAVVARVLPNEQLEEAIVEACRRHELKNAYVRGGSGSLIGAVFDGGPAGTRQVDGPATEVATLVGLVTDGQPEQLHAVLVDKHGNVAAGALSKGQNHVAVTLELILQEIAD